MTARRVSAAVAAMAFALTASGTALAAHHRTTQHLRVTHSTKLMAATSWANCPNMGSSSSSASA